jgi:transposase
MIAVGVDTHKHEHVAAALNELGELLGEIAVAASPAGYRELVKWLKGMGEGVLVGIEGAGSYGAGLCKYLQDIGMRVVEVERPHRRDRRAGKSDRIDALLAAKKVLAREGLSTPKTSGTRAGLAALLVAYRSCVGERTRLRNQIQALHITAPVALRERIGRGRGAQLERRLTCIRARPDAGIEEATILEVLRALARRARALDTEIHRYHREIARLVHSLDPTLLDEPGIGPISAGKLIACDPTRFKSEAAFARAPTAQRRNPHPRARRSATDSAEAETAKSTTPST